MAILRSFGGGIIYTNLMISTLLELSLPFRVCVCVSVFVRKCPCVAPFTRFYFGFIGLCDSFQILVAITVEKLLQRSAYFYCLI